MVWPARQIVALSQDKAMLKHMLSPLPYDYAALEPHIDARTLYLHHDKHHAGYVQHLNDALQNHPELHARSALWLLNNLGNVPEAIRMAVRNNAGGHVNHTLFWHAMTPAQNAKPQPPQGALADAIVRDFGSLEKLQERFVQAGAAVFGSGWVWLVRTPAADGKLDVVTTPGHMNPVVQGDYPLLVNDVWEHAYYLRHENRREEYLKNWWNLANWQFAAQRYERAARPRELLWHDDDALFLREMPGAVASAGRF